MKTKLKSNASNLTKKEKSIDNKALKTEAPLSEKDEVKQAEAKMNKKQN